MSAINLSIYLDDLAPVEAISVHASDQYPVSAHLFFTGLSMWAYDPQAFRRLADALTKAADQLDAARVHEHRSPDGDGQAPVRSVVPSGHIGTPSAPRVPLTHHDSARTTPSAGSEPADARYLPAPVERR